MSAQRIGILSALVTMVASGWYVVVYLGRWEWNRALVAAVIFVAAEVGLLGILLLDRLAKVQRRLHELERDPPEARRREPDPRLLARLHEAGPPSRRPFSWLGEPNQMSVFVPVLLGAGVLLSGVAWLVERLGRMTAGPTLERGLARRLESLALPPGGLLGEEAIDPYWPSP